MVTQTHSAVGVAVQINGHVTAKSGGVERVLKSGDIIYQDDEIISQGSAKILMTDGSFVDVVGSKSFEAGDYLPVPGEDGYPPHQSAESIQHALLKGLDPEDVSQAILSCVPLSMIIPNESHPTFYSIAWGHPGLVESGFPTGTETSESKRHFEPGSEFPIVQAPVVISPPPPPPLPEADLGVIKTDFSSTAVPGTVDVYTITVTNHGPDAVTSFTLNDVLPPSNVFENVTFDPNAGSYNPQTGLWSELNLGSGQSVVLIVSGTINASAAGILSNTATLTPPPGVIDVNINNNSSTDTDTLTPQDDLSVTKTDFKVNEIPGTGDTYTIVVTNNGPSDAVGAKVSDILPSNFLSDTWTASGTVGTLFTANSVGNISDIVNIPVGGLITYIVTGNISPDAAGSLTNVATVTSAQNELDTNLSNNTAADTDTLTPQCDLSVTKTKTVSDLTPYLGEHITYTITVHNAGPSTVTNASIVDSMPADIASDTWTAAVTLGSASGFSASGSGNINDNGVTMAPNSTITYTVNAVVNNFIFELGSINTSITQAQEMTSWSGATLYAYTLGTNFTDGGTIDSISKALANGTITFIAPSTTDEGIGVSQGASNNIDYNSTTHQSEAIVVDLGASHSNTESETVTLSGLSGGEQGEVTLYNSAGVQVSGPIIFEGTSGSGDNLTSISISPGVDFQYLAFTAIPSVSGGASSYNIEDIKYLPDTITNTANVSSAITDTNSANNSASAVIHPEVPIAKDATENVVPGTGKFNVEIILDVSGSMGDTVTVGGVNETKLAAAKAAINQLLNTYGTEGQAAVQLVTFSTNATIQTSSSWVTLSQAETIINGLSSGGSTNYDAALGLHPNGLGTNFNSGGEQAFAISSGKIAGGQDVLYFLTDGGPNLPNNTAGINPNISGNTGEEIQWQNFLTTNNITAYSLAMGLSGSALASASSGSNNDTVAQELYPIATNPAGNDSATPNAIFVTDLNQLGSALAGTVGTHTGNILTETGSVYGTGGSVPLPGYIQSIALIGDGYTYAFNPVTNTITQEGAGTSTFSFAAGTELLTITSSLGTVNVYMENSGGHLAGDYTFTTPSNITPTQFDVPIQFTVSDAANNSATAVLTVTNSDQIVAANSSGSTQNVIVTIVDESNPHNSESLLAAINPTTGANIDTLLYNDPNLTFNVNDKFAVSIESASTNTAAITINNFSLDGVTLQNSPLTLNPLSATGAGPFAETYVFQPANVINQAGTPSYQHTGTTVTPPDATHVYSLFAQSNSPANGTISPGTPTDGFGNFENGDALTSTVAMTATSNGLPSVMMFNANPGVSASDSYTGNGTDILQIDQGALGLSASVNLTGNSQIHNISELLITDTSPSSTDTTLTLSPSDVFDFTENAAHNATGNSNTLFINGGASDTAHIGTGWSTPVPNVAGYVEYQQIVSGHQVTLEIQQHVHVAA